MPDYRSERFLLCLGDSYLSPNEEFLGVPQLISSLHPQQWLRVQSLALASAVTFCVSIHKGAPPSHAL
jgi:hypothetical protein